MNLQEAQAREQAENVDLSDGVFLAADVHTHTLYSRHAYSTVQENCKAAAARGLSLLGITDHFSSMVYPELSDPNEGIKDVQHFLNMSCWPRSWEGVTLLRGAEADIVDLEGHLYGWDQRVSRLINGDALRAEQTIQEAAFAQCDYVIASVHGKDWARTASPSQVTRMYIAALEHPNVKIIGHPGRSGLDFEVDPVLEAARDLGKAIELNESSHIHARKQTTIERCRRLAERACELGCPISFGSDAHCASAIGWQKEVHALLEEIHAPEDLLVCKTGERFLQFVGLA